MINAAQRKTLLELATAEKATFVELASIAGLDPGTAFRGADLRGVDFAGCDLNGFDFTDADLGGASFRGASLLGAVFENSLGSSAAISAVRIGEIERAGLT